MIDPAQSKSCDLASITSDVARLESELVSGASGEVDAAMAALAGVRACGDDALLGRVLCLLSRTQIIHGQHELALRTAQEGLRAFEKLDAVEARRRCGFHAETFRAAGTALCKLGRVAEALPMLEEAVRVAEAGLESPSAPSAPEPHVTVISTQSALIRSLITLGVALFAIREIDTAIDVYNRALHIAEAYPRTDEPFLDDVMLTRCNLTDALHERVKRRRAAGDAELAAQDIAAARALLNAEAWGLDAAAGESGTKAGSPAETLSGYGRAAYYSALGQHLLITARPADARASFGQQLQEIGRLKCVDEWSVADARAGLAQAALALGSAREALDHTALALRALDCHDESNTRATVLLVRAQAHRVLGEHDAAYDQLEKHHALRARLEAVAAQQYASHMTAQLGLERARADAESHRSIAAMLASLGRIGQEMTANLDAVAVFEIFTRHVGSLLPASAFCVWLLDAAAQRLMLAFGIEDGHTISAADIAADEPQSLAARAVRERREIFITAASPDPRQTQVIHGTRAMQTALFVPLIVFDRVLGVVSIQSDVLDAYGENECSIFRTLCTYAAIALDNAAAYTKLEQTVVALQAAQSELAKQNAEFERLSMTDALTGVANRRHLHERAQAEIATMRRRRGQLAVVMFDIDHFKRVNDTYGHAAGDAVLQQIALVAKGWLRPADLIARIGGEEFALLLPDVDLREAVAIAERIRASIAGAVLAGGDDCVRVTSSFGVAALDATRDTLEHALSRADRALYAAKLAGRDRVHAEPLSNARAL